VNNNTKKSSTVRARIEPELKQMVEDILHNLGLSITEAITLFYTQVLLHNGLPFEIKIPNKATLQCFKDSDEGKNLVKCEDVNDLFQKLGL